MSDKYDYENELLTSNLNAAITIGKLKAEIQSLQSQLKRCEGLLLRFLPDEKTIQWDKREIAVKEYFKNKEGKDE